MSQYSPWEDELENSKPSISDFKTDYPQNIDPEAQDDLKKVSDYGQQFLQSNNEAKNNLEVGKNIFGEKEVLLFARFGVVFLIVAIISGSAYFYQQSKTFNLTNDKAINPYKRIDTSYQSNSSEIQPQVNASINPTPPSSQSADGSQAPYSRLDRDRAVSILQNYLQAKQRIFAPPFDRQLAGMYLTGNTYQRVVNPGGAIDWLQNNQSWYSYNNSKISDVWNFDANQNQLKVRIVEDYVLYRAGKKVKSERTTNNYTFYFTYENDSWKIYDRS